jgi:hypothetical protein
MKLQNAGKNTSADSCISNITPFGIWLCIEDLEYFLSYKEYPMFLNEPIAKIFNFKLTSPTHLHWPQLDVDIDLECLASPQKYPLLFKK